MSTSSSQQELFAVTSTFGPVSLTEHESLLFCSLFRLLDQEDRGVLSIDDCVSLWNRASIGANSLRDIVDITMTTHNRDGVTLEAFALGCKLVGMSLSGRSPDVSALAANPTTPLPLFSLASLPPSPPDASTGIGFGFGAGSEGSDFLKIEIDDSVTEGEGMSAFVRYRIKYSTNMPSFSHSEGDVYRRYSDFVWLQSQFKKDFPIFVVPPLPGKKLSKTNESTVQNRLQELDLFLKAVSSHPYLKFAMQFRFFLTANTPDKMELLKSMYSKMENMFRGDGFFSVDAEDDGSRPVQRKNRAYSGSLGDENLHDDPVDDSERSGGEDEDGSDHASSESKDNDMGTKAKKLMGSFWRSVKNEASVIRFLSLFLFLFCFVF